MWDCTIFVVRFNVLIPVSICYQPIITIQRSVLSAAIFPRNT